MSLVRQVHSPSVGPLVISRDTPYLAPNAWSLVGGDWECDRRDCGAKLRSMGDGLARPPGWTEIRIMRSRLVQAGPHAFALIAPRFSTTS